MFWALLCVLSILLVTHKAKGSAQGKFKFSVLGSIAGAANCSANYIVLCLSAAENASVLFPIISVSNIIAVWAIGIIFFRERLKFLQVIGLITGVISVVFLKF